MPFKMLKHHVDAFLQLRDMLKNIPTLAYPDESENGGQFFHTCDASMSAASYVLTQVQRQVDGRELEVLIACGGRALRDAETRWPPIHTEALAVLLGIIAYKHYFVGRRVTVRTDSLTVSFVKDLRKSKHNRLFRWGLFLDTIPNLDFVHVPGKLNVVADMLSRRPYDSPPPPSQDESQLTDEMMVCAIAQFADFYESSDSDGYEFAGDVFELSECDVCSDRDVRCDMQSDCCSDCCSGFWLYSKPS